MIGTDCVRARYFFQTLETQLSLNPFLSKHWKSRAETGNLFSKVWKPKPHHCAAEPTVSVGPV